MKLSRLLPVLCFSGLAVFICVWCFGLRGRPRTTERRALEERAGPAAAAATATGERDGAAPPEAAPETPADSAASPEPAPAAIRGRIYLEAPPAPAPGARVAAVLDGAREPARVGEADAEGRYELALAAGRYRLWAWRDDWTLDGNAYSQAPVELEAGKTLEDVDLVLVPGAVVTGVVRRSDSREPLAGAMVHFALLQFASTDADGAFRLEGIPPGLQMIVAGAAGFTRSWTEVEVAVGESPSVVLEVEPAGVIEGTVTGAGGEPVAGVEVETVVVQTGITAKSDAAGFYRLEAIPLNARNQRVTASLADRFRTEAVAGGFTEGESTVKLDIQLAAGFRLAGRVLDRAGKPVAGAEIFVDWSTWEPVASSDPEGRFVVDGAREAMQMLTARKKGYAPGSRALQDLASPRERESIELLLEPGHFVAGSVVDQASKPVRKAWVYVDIDKHAGPYPRCDTDEAGRFRFEDLPAACKEIGATKAGHCDSRGNPVLLDRDDVVLVLGEAGQIEGLVTEKETGNPIEHFSVRVNYFEPSQQPQHFPGGRFRLQSDLVPGAACKLAVVAEGYQAAILEEVKPWPLSGTREPLRIALERGRFLSGQVVSSATAEPIAGVQATHVDRRHEEDARGTLWFEGRPHDLDWVARTAVTGADGSFRLAGVSENPGVLFLARRGFARTVVAGIRPQAATQGLRAAAGGRRGRGREERGRGGALRGRGHGCRG